MSEEMSSSAPASEPVKPEPLSPPKKDDKKKLWLMIVAVIVAILLISTAVYVLVIRGDDEPEEIGLDIESEILPSDSIALEAKEMVELSVSSNLVNDTEGISHDIDLWTNVTYSWARSPTTLGTFDLMAKRVVVFTATNVSASGTVTCTITWSGKTTQVTADIVVNPPYLDTVFVTPSSKTLSPEEPYAFTASGMNSVGDLLPTLSCTWTVSGMDAADYTLSATTGSSVTFTGLVEGNAVLTATASLGGITKSGTASISVGGPPMRTVDYLYYDLFNVPFGEWWSWRWDNYHTEEVVSWEYPYVFKWYGNSTNVWLYTNQRLELTARNLPEINMNENPEFLPLLGDVRGGTATVDWYLQYLTEAEMDRYPENTAGWLDGWVVALNGTVTLDRTAAMAVMGITSEGFDNFDTWWAGNQVQFMTDYIDWILYEGNERLDIFCAYEYQLVPLSFNVDAEKVSDEIVLTFDTVSWGMEVLMTRWLKDAFMPVEWYFEDMYFQATIGPEYTDIDMDTAVVYAAYAYETTLDTQPCWMWEALMQDYVPSFGTHDYSLFDVYEDLEYVNYAPGSPWYGTLMPYDYSPGAHNLSENETMVLEWPTGEFPFYAHGGDYVTINYTAEMTCNYSEPDWIEFPGQVILDKDGRTLSFEGPIDFWTWSKYQWETLDTSRYQNLANEWDRLEGTLPYGCPTIEFRMKSGDDPEATAFRVEGIDSPILEGDTSSVTVTVLDQYGALYPMYTGTIEFSSDDTGATLPSSYTFVPADNGVKTFADGVAFSAAGTYYVRVEDSSDSDIFGVQVNIVVTGSSVPTSLLVEDVTSPIVEGVASGFSITVLDQNDDPYLGGDYVGTIRFSSNDSAADLPADYTFTVGDDGTHTWDAVDGVTFNTAGTRDLTAYDIDTPSIAGSQLNIIVTEMPRMDSFEVVLSADTAIANDTLLDVTVTALDQFGDPFPGYVGTVEFSTDDTVADVPIADLEFVVGDLGVKTWTGEIMMGTPGVRTITVTDTTDGYTGSDDVTVTAERAATYFIITDMAPTVQVDEPEMFTVTVYDQYDDVFTPYDGTVTFTTNRSGEATLPSDYPFDPGTDMGTHDFSITFTVVNYFTVTVADYDDSSIDGEVTNIRVVADKPYLHHFLVEGIESPMWEDNYSDVKVTAIDQYDSVFVGYVDTISFSTDAVADTYELPADYTFLVTDDGVKTFPSGVMFEDGGTYWVAVTNSSGIETGSQTDIEIINLEAYRLEITGEPVGVVGPDEPFSLTVSVYHQYNELCYDYEGTVTFSTSDTDGDVVLPSNYPFTLGDGGTHVFTDGFMLVSDGTHTITAEDTLDASLTDTVSVTVEVPPQREVDYKIYDFLEEPFGPWWADRWYYATDVILTEGADGNTYLFYVQGEDPADADTQGMIYAPYRYNITARNLTELNVHHPEFLPEPTTQVAGAQADVSVYFQYIYEPWYTELRNAWMADDYYGAVPNWMYCETTQEGYLLVTFYTVTMNRQAALEWIDLPLTEDDPVSWYDSGAGDDYSATLGDWFENEGDVRLDISYGYEDQYWSEYTSTKLAYDDGTDEVTLKIAHFNWGYEVLMTRWLTEAGVSPNHEPWYEDFRMNVSYGEVYTDLDMDAVCQYSLHAVKANGTVDGAAWAWEPNHIDYCLDEDVVSGTPGDRPNEYLPYSTLTYQSWNAGDNQFGEEVGYEYTPYWFNLSEGERLIFEMPTDPIIGYDGVGLDWTDYNDAVDGDMTAFEAIQNPGDVSLGYFVTSGVDLGAMVAGNTLTIEGPVSFDNVRHSPDGPLYHGAPWIEFDVVPGKLAAEPAEESAALSASASVTPAVVEGSALGMLSMMAMVCATLMAVAALGVGRRIRV